MHWKHHLGRDPVSIKPTSNSRLFGFFGLYHITSRSHKNRRTGLVVTHTSMSIDTARSNMKFNLLCIGSFVVMADLGGIKMPDFCIFAGISKS
jgi:hypothetical protein